MTKDKDCLTKDYSVSLIRMIAFIFIFSCHIMQYFDCILAWWFNVGVQIFLFISGYLYGAKKIDDAVKFYFKSFKKILIPYYIVLVPVIVIQIIFLGNLSKSKIVKCLIMHNTVNGGGHLWFIPYILMCYLITPLLQKLCSKTTTNKHVYPHIIAILIAFSITFFYFIPYYNFVWIVCYILGYFFGFFKDRIKLLKYIICIGSLFNLVQIYVGNIMHLNMSGNVYYNIFCDMNHVCLAIVLFFVFKKIFDNINFNCNFVRGICDFSDKYSYSAYLVHQFIILGPFTLMALTPFKSINVIIVFTLTILLAVIVKLIEDKVVKKVVCVGSK